ncbi:MAG: amidase [Planctomycetia bacterium]|nr:amidase [Planctomycetia bacterium]
MTDRPPSAAFTAHEVVAGRLRAVDVLAASSGRQRAVGQRLNALIQPRPAEAAEEAAAIDERAAAGALGSTLLAGVPISVKECFPVRGLLTTLGIPSRRGVGDSHDAPLVERLRAAGAVVIGKANVPQAMYLHETTNPVWGRTLHPFDPERGPGGSSGGDAALVAAGIATLAVGNDLAGSLRQPAHACGIVAIMPRTVALGDGGAFDTMPHLSAVHPRAGFLTRTVGDAELALIAAGLPLATAAPRCVAWWDKTGPIPASPAIRRAVHEAVERLTRQGIVTVRMSADLAVAAAWLHLAILAADGGADVRGLFAGSQPMPGVRRLLAIAGLPRRWRPAVAACARLLGRRIEAEGVSRTGPRTSAELAALVAARDALAVRFAAAVAGCDAVVCPVSALPALRHGTAARLVLAAAPCLLANLLDLPAGAVPVTSVRADEEHGRPWSFDPVLRTAAETDHGSRGLPVGVQVVGCPGHDEATVLRVMHLIETGSPARH